MRVARRFQSIRDVGPRRVACAGAVAALVAISSACSGGPPEELNLRSEAPSDDSGQVWAFDGSVLAFVDGYESTSSPATDQRNGVVYGRKDGVTARIIYAPDMLEDGAENGFDASRDVSPAGNGGVVASVPLGNGAGFSLTISGEKDTTAAKETTEALVRTIGDGRSLGFNS